MEIVHFRNCIFTDALDRLAVDDGLKGASGVD